MALPIKKEIEDTGQEQKVPHNVLVLNISKIDSPHRIEGSFLTREFFRSLDGIMVDSTERNGGKIVFDETTKKHLLNATLDYAAPSHSVVSNQSNQNYIGEKEPQLNFGDSVKLFIKASIENVELFLTDRKKYAWDLSQIVRPKDKPLKLGAPDPKTVLIEINRASTDLPALPSH